MIPSQLAHVQRVVLDQEQNGASLLETPTGLSVCLSFFLLFVIILSSPLEDQQLNLF